MDREEFRFVAVDAAFAVWRWMDDEMVWVRQGTETVPKARSATEAR